MSITPFRPVGVGAATQAYNVFQVTFSQALSDIPLLTAYDDFNITTNNNTLFLGTTNSGNQPMIAAVAGKQGVTSYPALSGSPSGWFPASQSLSYTPLGTPNLLNGSLGAGVNLDTTATLSGGSVTFNLSYKYFNDLTTLATMDGVVICQYQYTGALPTATFYGNQSPGTESVPSWTPLIPQSAGVAPVVGTTTQIRPCDSNKGASGTGTYTQTIPAVGATFPQEIWLKNY